MIKFYLHTPELLGWQDVFLEMFEKMDSSGLIVAADEIHFCFNGRKESGQAIFGSITESNSKLKFHHVNNDASKWEWPTINKLKQDADADDVNDHYIGYAHLKGLSRPDPKDKKAADWRHLLSYFTIEQWAESIALLAQGYETASINWTDAPWPHYSGNFWWARSNYIRRLGNIQDPSTIPPGTVSKFLSSVPPVTLDPGNYRYEHEAWIGSNKPNHANMFDSPGKTDQSYHYRFEYPASNYRKD
jgi:hypothetical protein